MSDNKNAMEITIYAKKKQTTEGKTFTAFLAKLNKKDGSTVTASVKFREDCGQPKLEECPMNIIIEDKKRDANMSTRTYTREDTGEDATSYTLWINAWKRSANVYEDHSLDDFE